MLDTVVPCDALLARWEVDFRAVRMRPPEQIDDNSADRQGFAATCAAVVIQPHGHRFGDEFGTVWQKADLDYAPVRYAFADFTQDDLKRFRWPDPYDPGRVAGLEQEAQELGRSTEFCIVGDMMCGGPFEQACWLRGYSAFLTDLHVDPAFAVALLEAITELDMGMQDREYISPEMYRKYVFPRHKRLYDFIHSRTRAKIFMHSCGSIRKLIPFLIEAGVDALNPVQYSAANMDLVGLKREFGAELSFWGGGMDTQHGLLGHDVSPQSIEADVRRNMEILMKGGGFVFAAAHNIQHEIPPETTLLAYDTAVRNRRYR